MESSEFSELQSQFIRLQHHIIGCERNDGEMLID